MKKVYQTIVDKEKGNCMQAAIASLLNLKLREVPNFLKHERNNSFYGTIYGFCKSKGYKICTISRYKRTLEQMIEIAKFDGGVDGYFYASVPSQTFDDVSHAVIVDVNLNIVHDPNPNQKALKLKPNDVDEIMIMNGIIIGATGKLYKPDEYDKLSQEQRNLEIWK